MTDTGDEVLRVRVETCGNPNPEFIEVTAVGGDGEPDEVEILVGFCDVDGDHEDERPGQTCLYATPEQADRIAVAMIQASDLAQHEADLLGIMDCALASGGLEQPPADEMVRMGLALIRAARSV